jgi:serine/threonine-protein kinase RsbW
VVQVLALQPDPNEVRVAREFCVRELAPLVAASDRADELIDDAAMITSELVTNSIRAGATTIRLQVKQNGATFRIGVVDDADGDVVPTEPQPLAVNGRGLYIVAALAQQWGVEPRPTGKLVWADLTLPIHADQGREFEEAS